MSNVLNGLNPQEIWKIFGEICNIPHPSKKEEKISEYTVAFGKRLGLETIVDEVGNVIIKKPATKGMENRKTIILQSHLDMVPQKNSDVNHDFEKDPIVPRIEGEWVKATGTTLGADNGIGAAATLAILESKNVEHGPIEALFTIDEETGMTGAFGLKSGLLDGDILLNLDSEDEGELYIGCAGGVDSNICLKYTEESIPSNVTAYKITVKGLLGGHSGLDIILQRGNSIKIINRLLWNSSNKYQLKLSSIQGGSLRNAIPREAFATVVVPNENKSEFEKYVIEYEKTIKTELIRVDKNVSVKAEQVELPKTIINPETANKLYKGLYACPNGVYGMSNDMIGLVETSNNLALVESKNGKIIIQNLQRGSVESLKEDLSDMIRCVFESIGAEVVNEGAYPGWKPNVDSEILSLMKEVYQKLYGRTPEVKAIHAGLECGLLGSVYPKWDMISFGPTIRSPHSPDERVNIESVDKFWKYLKETLKNAPVK